MNINEFKLLCETHPELEINFQPYNCGSWRGVYAEPCIFISEGKSVLSAFLPFIERLTTEDFYGYKGGDYRYEDCDPINFEISSDCWSDGETLQRLLIENHDLASLWSE